MCTVDNMKKYITRVVSAVSTSFKIVNNENQVYYSFTNISLRNDYSQ